MLEDILNFEVRLFSNDGINSPILDYLYELNRKNQGLAKQAINDLYTLPEHCYLFTNIKYFKYGSYKFYELRVRFKDDICRFFFTIENPNLCVVYGFTKKTQKTEQKDIEKGIDYLKQYQINRNSIKLKDIGSLI
jgi:phage-related protein